MRTALVAIMSFGLAWVVPQLLPGRSTASLSAAGNDAATVQEYLDLTSEQQQKLEALSAKLRERAHASMQDLESKQKALRMRLASDDMDALAAGKALIDLEVAKHQTERISDSLRNQAMTVLSPEQREKLQALGQAEKLHPVARQAMGLFLLAPPDEFLNGTGPLGMFPARKRPLTRQST